MIIKKRDKQILDWYKGSKQPSTDGYNIKEYIKYVGNNLSDSHISTDYFPTSNNVKVRIRVRLDDLYSYWCGIFSLGRSYREGYSLFKNNVSTPQFGGTFNSLTVDDMFNIQLGVVYDVEFGQGYVSCTSDSTSDRKEYTNTWNGVSSKPLVFFGLNTSDRTAHATIYNLLVYEDDILVGDWVAVERQSDGKYGMYNKVTDRFYENTYNTYEYGDTIGHIGGTIGKKINKAYHGSTQIWGKAKQQGFPIDDFMFNYNFKNYVEDTKTVPNEPNANWSENLVLRGTPTSVGADNIVITNSNAYAQYNFATSADNPFNKGMTSPLTIIYKIGNCASNSVDLISNRGSSGYNYMVRPRATTSCVHYTTEFASIGITTNPTILCFINKNNSSECVHKNITENTEVIGTVTSGSYLSNALCFFKTNNMNNNIDRITEKFSGTVYWLFLAKRELTDEEVNAVIEYNENL